MPTHQHEIDAAFFPVRVACEACGKPEGVYLICREALHPACFQAKIAAIPDVGVPARKKTFNHETKPRKKAQKALAEP